MKCRDIPRREKTTTARRVPEPLTAAVVAAVLLLGAGCGVYSTTPGTLPSHIRKVAIPTFENQTTEVGLDQEITQAVVDRFVADNNLRVVDEDDADAVMSGAITVYKNSIFGFTGNVEAEEYRVAITVAVRLLDRVKNRELWSDDAMTKTANYFVVQVPGQEAQNELTGREEAISKIADEILTRTVDRW